MCAHIEAGGAQGRPRGGDLVSSAVASSTSVLHALTLPLNTIQIKKNNYLLIYCLKKEKIL
jgi:hypothetical protein